MKILQITYNLRSGGAERFVVDLCNNLSKNDGNQVYLLATDDDSRQGNQHYLGSLSKKVKYICARASKGLSFKSLYRTYRIIKELKPDVVHAHCSILLLLFPALVFNKVRFVHTLHTLAENNTSHRKLKSIEKILYSKYIQAVTISNICNKSFVDYYGIDKVKCVPNGRDALIVTDKYPSVKDEIMRRKRSDRTPVFIHVATFYGPKNQQLLFDTFMRLENEREDFLLIVLGALYENCTHPYVANGKNVVIFGRKENVGDYMSCADFFVMSSIWEGLPLSLLEAMSMGVVPVCTPAGGIVDVISDGANGYLSPSFDTDDFYTTVKRALENPTNIKKEDIIECYNKNYTISICADKYFEVYKNV